MSAINYVLLVPGLLCFIPSSVLQPAAHLWRLSALSVSLVSRQSRSLHAFIVLFEILSPDPCQSVLSVVSPDHYTLLLFCLKYSVRTRVSQSCQSSVAITTRFYCSV